MPPVGQDPSPEIKAFARPPHRSPRATREREVQEDDHFRGPKARLDNVQGAKISVHDPRLIGDEQMLCACPLVARCGEKAGLPEDLIQLHDGKTGDLAEAFREGRFARRPAAEDHHSLHTPHRTPQVRPVGWLNLWIERRPDLALVHLDPGDEQTRITGGGSRMAVTGYKEAGCGSR